MNELEQQVAESVREAQVAELSAELALASLNEDAAQVAELQALLSQLL